MGGCKVVVVGEGGSGKTCILTFDDTKKCSGREDEAHKRMAKLERMCVKQQNKRKKR